MKLERLQNGVSGRDFWLCVASLGARFICKLHLVPFGLDGGICLVVLVVLVCRRTYRPDTAETELSLQITRVFQTPVQSISETLCFSICKMGLIICFLSDDGKFLSS